MNNIIDRDYEDQFANGKISRDLRANPDSTQSKTNLEVVNVTERCCDVTREEFSTPENWECARKRRGAQFLPEQVDADERLPGYLREPHIPRFESRSVRKFASQRVSPRSFALADYCGPVPIIE